VHRSSGGHVFGAMVTQGEHIEIGEKVFAGAKEDEADSDMQFVDETDFEILADDGRIPAKPNVLPIGNLASEI
jgi:hypothetical protein